MSRGDRGAVFAFGLGVGTAIALFFFVWAFPWFSDPTQSAGYDCAGDQQCAEQYQNQNDPHFWVRPFYGWLFAEDSLAQWLMAAFGVVATGVSFWAVIIVRDTLELNRISTDAAVSAVKVTRRIGEAGLRAYVNCRDCEITYLAPDACPTAVLGITNDGETPASNVIVFARADLFPWPETRNEVIFVSSDKSTVGLIGDQIYPRDVIMRKPVSQQDINAYYNGEKALFVSIEIVFVDIFGLESKVKQKFVLTPDDLIKGKCMATPAKLGNEYKWGYKKA